MPSLKELSNNLSTFRYYNGIGNFTANKIPYGKDLPSGGSSNQPFVRTPPGFQWSPSNFDDGFIRFGAVTATTRTAADLLRIGKFLTTTVQGPLFLLKQYGLQHTNPKIEFKGEATKNYGPTRQYTPLPLLAQVAGNAIGARYMRHGIIPKISDTTEYEKYVYKKDLDSQGKDNRLVNLYQKLSDSTTPESKQGYILKYSGGPNSFYGIGNTTIRRYGSILTNTKLPSTGSYKKQVYNNGNTSSLETLLTTYSTTVGLGDYTINLNGTAVRVPNTSTPLLGGSVKTADNISNGFISIPVDKIINPAPDRPFTPFGQEVKPKDTPFIVGEKIDFRIYKNKLNEERDLQGITLPTSDYSKYNLEDRIGITKNRSKFHKSNYTYTSKDSQVLDTVNALSLYYSSGPQPGKGALDLNNREIVDTPNGNRDVGSIRDMIKFRIKSIDNNNPSSGIYMVFRAYITNLKRDVTAKWNPYTYVGRGENFYLYDGFTETISFNFDIVASSRYEMRPLYQKLNYLISTLTPDYYNNRMRGNISELTVGDFILYQPGIITNLSMNVDENTNWDIAIDEPENREDKDMHELPQMIRCSITFIPIYNFLPRKSIDKSPFIGIDYSGDEKEGQKWLSGSGSINLGMVGKKADLVENTNSKQAKK